MTMAARQVFEKVVLPDGRAVIVRAIRPDDRERLQAAFLRLEPESVYLRYFAYKKDLTEADLDRLCNPDFRERVVLVVTMDAVDGQPIIGSGGYVASPATNASRMAEVAFVVQEDFQGQGLALLSVATG